MAAEQTTDATFPKAGEWGCYRRDGSQQARSPLKGKITDPKVAWKYFAGTTETQFVVVPNAGDTQLRIPVAKPLDAPAPASDPRWGLTPEQGLIEGRMQAIPYGGLTTYADILPDVPGLEKIEFENGFAKPTVNGQWSPCVGRCFAWKNGAWEKVWETAPIDMMFGGYPIVGDFDGDGKLELALAPWWRLMIFDATTGKLKQECRFTEARSYGLFAVYDLDGDGKSEFIFQSDFCKHIDVLGYRDGQLKVLWQHAIEQDIINPQKMMRVVAPPVADVQGSGVMDMIACIYNDSGDGRWHTLVYGGLTGKIIADFPDEILQGIADVNGDGISELLTIRATNSGIPDYGTVMVRNCKGGTPNLLWSEDNAGWAMWSPPPAHNIHPRSTYGMLQALCRVSGKQAKAAIRRPSAEGTDDAVLQLVLWADDGFKVVSQVLGPNLSVVAIHDDGRMLVRAVTRPGQEATVRMSNGAALAPERQEGQSAAPTNDARWSPGSKRRGTPTGPAVVAWSKGDKAPMVIVQSSAAPDELVLFRPPPSGGQQGRELRRVDGRGQSRSWPGTTGPVIADLSGDGERKLIFATAASSGCGRLVVCGLDGKEVWHHDFEHIPGTDGRWNTGAVTDWQVGHFVDKTRQDILVTVRRSMMHSEETLLLSGRDGKKLWHRTRQSVQNNMVGGMPFAIADFNGDGLDDAAQLHECTFYILDGRTGKDIIAEFAKWKEVPAWMVYWGIPFAGDFEGTGKPSVFFGTTRRSMTGLIRADGSLAWFDALDRSPTCLPAFGDFDGGGRMQAVGLGYDDGIRCYDTATGQVRWKMPLPAAGGPFGTVSGDIDSDGRDEVLFVIGKTLYCLGTDKEGKQGVVKWKLDLPCRVGPPVIADVDGSGMASILLVGSDGNVYCVR